MNEVVFDIETKTFFDEMDTNDPADLGVSIVSAYIREVDENGNETSGQMQSFWENQFNSLWQAFESADRIIGFNSIRFDVPVLQPYAPLPLAKLPHFDILNEVKRAYGKRVSLDRIAQQTVGNHKNDNPVNAITYWKSGDKQSLDKLKRYCEMDVALTRDIYDHVMQKGFIKFKDHWNELRTVELDFSYPKDSNQQIGLF